MKPTSISQLCVRALTAALFLVGTQACVLARPARSIVGSAPAALGARTVDFPSRSGSVIKAWLAVGRPGMGAVLLLHGMGGNRANMLTRARFLHREGFTILAPDFQAHGESSGEHITFGELESLDAAAALDYLRKSVPGERVGIIGVSMGGAATLVGDRPLAADALVLESVYPTFKDAVGDRIDTWLGPFGFLGAAVTPLLMQFVAPRIGVNPSRLKPIDDISKIGEPLLLIAGTDDQYTRLDESRALFERAAGPKLLWEVNGAGHEDLHDFAPLEYERRVGQFLISHLRLSRSTSFDASGAAGRDTQGTCRIEWTDRRGCFK